MSILYPFLKTIPRNMGIKENGNRFSNLDYLIPNTNPGILQYPR